MAKNKPIQGPKEPPGYRNKPVQGPKEPPGYRAPKSVANKVNTPIDKAIRESIAKQQMGPKPPPDYGPQEAERDLAADMEKMRREQQKAVTRSEQSILAQRQAEVDDPLRPGTGRQAPALPKHYDSIYGFQIREKEQEQEDKPVIRPGRNRMQTTPEEQRGVAPTPPKPLYGPVEPPPKQLTGRVPDILRGPYEPPEKGISALPSAADVFRQTAETQDKIERGELTDVPKPGKSFLTELAPHVQNYIEDEFINNITGVPQWLTGLAGVVPPVINAVDEAINTAVQSIPKDLRDRKEAEQDFLRKLDRDMWQARYGDLGMYKAPADDEVLSKDDFTAGFYGEPSYKPGQTVRDDGRLTRTEYDRQWEEFWSERQAVQTSPEMAELGERLYGAASDLADFQGWSPYTKDIVLGSIESSLGTKDKPVEARPTSSQAPYWTQFQRGVIANALPNEIAEDPVALERTIIELENKALSPMGTGNIITQYLQDAENEANREIARLQDGYEKALAAPGRVYQGRSVEWWDKEKDKAWRGSIADTGNILVGAVTQGMGSAFQAVLGSDYGPRQLQGVVQAVASVTMGAGSEAVWRSPWIPVPFGGYNVSPADLLTTASSVIPGRDTEIINNKPPGVPYSVWFNQNLYKRSDDYYTGMLEKQIQADTLSGNQMGADNARALLETGAWRGIDNSLKRSEFVQDVLGSDEAYNIIASEADAKMRELEELTVNNIPTTEAEIAYVENLRLQLAEAGRLSESLKAIDVRSWAQNYITTGQQFVEILRPDPVPDFILPPLIRMMGWSPAARRMAKAAAKSGVEEAISGPPGAFTPTGAGDTSTITLNTPGTASGAVDATAALNSGSAAGKLDLKQVLNNAGVVPDVATPDTAPKAQQAQILLEPYGAGSAVIYKTPAGSQSPASVIGIVGEENSIPIYAVKNAQGETVFVNQNDIVTERPRSTKQPVGYAASGKPIYEGQTVVVTPVDKNGIRQPSMVAKVVTRALKAAKTAAVVPNIEVLLLDTESMKAGVAEGALAQQKATVRLDTVEPLADASYAAQVVDADGVINEVATAAAVAGPEPAVVAETFGPDKGGYALQADDVVTVRVQDPQTKQWNESKAKVVGPGPKSDTVSVKFADDSTTPIQRKYVSLDETTGRKVVDSGEAGQTKWQSVKERPSVTASKRAANVLPQIGSIMSPVQTISDARYLLRALFSNIGSVRGSGLKAPPGGWTSPYLQMISEGGAKAITFGNDTLLTNPDIFTDMQVLQRADINEFFAASEVLNDSRRGMLTNEDIMRLEHEFMDLLYTQSARDMGQITGDRAKAPFNTRRASVSKTRNTIVEFRNDKNRVIGTMQAISPADAERIANSVNKSSMMPTDLFNQNLIYRTGNAIRKAEGYFFMGWNPAAFVANFANPVLYSISDQSNIHIPGNVFRLNTPDIMMTNLGKWYGGWADATARGVMDSGEISYMGGDGGGDAVWWKRWAKEGPMRKMLRQNEADMALRFYYAGVRQFIDKFGHNAIQQRIVPDLMRMGVPAPVAKKIGDTFWDSFNGKGTQAAFKDVRDLINGNRNTMGLSDVDADWTKYGLPPQAALVFENILETSASRDELVARLEQFRTDLKSPEGEKLLNSPLSQGRYFDTAHTATVELAELASLAQKSGASPEQVKSFLGVVTAAQKKMTKAARQFAENLIQYKDTAGAQWLYEGYLQLRDERVKITAELDELSESIYVNGGGREGMNQVYLPRAQELWSNFYSETAPRVYADVAEKARNGDKPPSHSAVEHVDWSTINEKDLFDILDDPTGSTTFAEGRDAGRALHDLAIRLIYQVGIKHNIDAVTIADFVSSTERDIGGLADQTRAIIAKGESDILSGGYDPKNYDRLNLNRSNAWRGFYDELWRVANDNIEEMITPTVTKGKRGRDADMALEGALFEVQKMTQTEVDIKRAHELRAEIRRKLNLGGVGSVGEPQTRVKRVVITSREGRISRANFARKLKAAYRLSDFDAESLSMLVDVVGSRYAEMHGDDNLDSFYRKFFEDIVREGDDPDAPAAATPPPSSSKTVARKPKAAQPPATMDADDLGKANESGPPPTVDPPGPPPPPPPTPQGPKAGPKPGGGKPPKAGPKAPKVTTPAAAVDAEPPPPPEPMTYANADAIIDTVQKRLTGSMAVAKDGQPIDMFLVATVPPPRTGLFPEHGASSEMGWGFTLFSDPVDAKAQADKVNGSVYLANMATTNPFSLADRRVASDWLEPFENVPSYGGTAKNMLEEIRAILLLDPVNQTGLVDGKTVYNAILKVTGSANATISALQMAKFDSLYNAYERNGAGHTTKYSWTAFDGQQVVQALSSLRNLRESNINSNLIERDILDKAKRAASPGQHMEEGRLRVGNKDDLVTRLAKLTKEVERQLGVVDETWGRKREFVQNSVAQTQSGEPITLFLVPNKGGELTDASIAWNGPYGFGYYVTTDIKSAKKRAKAVRGGDVPVTPVVVDLRNPFDTAEIMTKEQWAVMMDQIPSTIPGDKTGTLGDQFRKQFVAPTVPKKDFEQNLIFRQVNQQGKPIGEDFVYGKDVYEWLKTMAPKAPVKGKNLWPLEDFANSNLKKMGYDGIYIYDTSTIGANDWEAVIFERRQVETAVGLIPRTPPNPFKERPSAATGYPERRPNRPEWSEADRLRDANRDRAFNNTWFANTINSFPAEKRDVAGKVMRVIIADDFDPYIREKFTNSKTGKATLGRIINSVLHRFPNPTKDDIEKSIYRFTGQELPDRLKEPVAPAVTPEATLPIGNISAPEPAARPFIGTTEPGFEDVVLAPVSVFRVFPKGARGAGDPIYSQYFPTYEAAAAHHRATAGLPTPAAKTKAATTAAPASAAAPTAEQLAAWTKEVGIRKSGKEGYRVYLKGAPADDPVIPTAFPTKEAALEAWHKRRAGQVAKGEKAVEPGFGDIAIRKSDMFQLRNKTTGELLYEDYFNSEETAWQFWRDENPADEVDEVGTTQQSSIDPGEFAVDAVMDSEVRVIDGDQNKEWQYPDDWDFARKRDFIRTAMNADDISALQMMNPDGFWSQYDLEAIWELLNNLMPKVVDYARKNGAEPENIDDVIGALESAPDMPDEVIDTNVMEPVSAEELQSQADEIAGRISPPTAAATVRAPQGQQAGGKMPPVPQNITGFDYVVQGTKKANDGDAWRRSYINAVKAADKYVADDAALSQISVQSTTKLKKRLGRIIAAADNGGDVLTAAVARQFSNIVTTHKKGSATKPSDYWMEPGRKKALVELTPQEFVQVIENAVRWVKHTHRDVGIPQVDSALMKDAVWTIVTATNARHSMDEILPTGEVVNPLDRPGLKTVDILQVAADDMLKGPPPLRSEGLPAPLSGIENQERIRALREAEAADAAEAARASRLRTIEDEAASAFPQQPRPERQMKNRLYRRLSAGLREAADGSLETYDEWAQPFQVADADRRVLSDTEKKDIRYAFAEELQLQKMSKEQAQLKKYREAGNKPAKGAEGEVLEDANITFVDLMRMFNRILTGGRFANFTPASELAGILSQAGTLRTAFLGDEVVNDFMDLNPVEQSTQIINMVDAIAEGRAETPLDVVVKGWGGSDMRPKKSFEELMAEQEVTPQDLLEDIVAKQDLLYVSQRGTDDVLQHDAYSRLNYRLKGIESRLNKMPSGSAKAAAWLRKAVDTNEGMTFSALSHLLNSTGRTFTQIFADIAERLDAGKKVPETLGIKEAETGTPSGVTLWNLNQIRKVGPSATYADWHKLVDSIMNPPDKKKKAPLDSSDVEKFFARPEIVKIVSKDMYEENKVGLSLIEDVWGGEGKFGLLPQDLVKNIKRYNALTRDRRAAIKEAGIQRNADVAKKYGIETNEFRRSTELSELDKRTRQAMQDAKTPAEIDAAAKARSKAEKILSRRGKPTYRVDDMIEMLRNIYGNKAAQEPRAGEKPTRGSPIGNDIYGRQIYQDAEYPYLAVVAAIQEAKRLAPGTLTAFFHETMTEDAVAGFLREVIYGDNTSLIEWDKEFNIREASQRILSMAQEWKSQQNSNALFMRDVKPQRNPKVIDTSGRVLGTTTWIDDNAAALLKGMTGSNKVTATHEVTHVLRRIYWDMAASGDANALKHTDAVERHYGIKRSGWTAVAEERFVNDFMVYMKQGKAPIGALYRVFETMAQWFRDFFDKVAGFNNLSPVMKEMFDDMLSPSREAQEKYLYSKGPYEEGTPVLQLDETRPGVAKKGRPGSKTQMYSIEGEDVRLDVANAAPTDLWKERQFSDTSDPRPMGRDKPIATTSDGRGIVAGDTISWWENPQKKRMISAVVKSYNPEKKMLYTVRREKTANGGYKEFEKPVPLDAVQNIRQTGNTYGAEIGGQRLRYSVEQVPGKPYDSHVINALNKVLRNAGFPELPKEIKKLEDVDRKLLPMLEAAADLYVATVEQQADIKAGSDGAAKQAAIDAAATKLREANGLTGLSNNVETPTLSAQARFTMEKIDSMVNKAIGMSDELFDSTTTNGETMDPQTAMQALGYMFGDGRAMWDKVLSGASLHGENMRSFQQIDFINQTRIDDIVSLFAPYHFWKTRTIKNAAERMWSEPSFYWHMYKLQKALEEQAPSSYEEEQRKQAETDAINAVRGGKFLPPVKPARLSGYVDTGINIPRGWVPGVDGEGSYDLMLRWVPGNVWPILPTFIANTYSDTSRLDENNLTNWLYSQQQGAPISFHPWYMEAWEWMRNRSLKPEEQSYRSGRVADWAPLTGIVAPAIGLTMVNPENWDKAPAKWLFTQNTEYYIARAMANAVRRGELSEKDEAEAAEYLAMKRNGLEPLPEWRNVDQENVIRTIQKYAVEANALYMMEQVSRSLTSVTGKLHDPTENEVRADAARFRNSFYGSLDDPDAVTNPYGTEGGAYGFREQAPGVASRSRAGKLFDPTDRPLLGPLKGQMFDEQSAFYDEIDASERTAIQELLEFDPYAQPRDASIAKLQGSLPVLAKYLGEETVMKFMEQFDDPADAAYNMGQMTELFRTKLAEKYPTITEMERNQEQAPQSAQNPVDIRGKKVQQALKSMGDLPNAPVYDSSMTQEEYQQYNVAKEAFEEKKIEYVMKQTGLPRETAERLITQYYSKNLSPEERKLKARYDAESEAMQPYWDTYQTLRKGEKANFMRDPANAEFSGYYGREYGKWWTDAKEDDTGRRDKTKEWLSKNWPSGYGEAPRPDNRTTASQLEVEPSSGSDFSKDWEAWKALPSRGAGPAAEFMAQHPEFAAMYEKDYGNYWDDNPANDIGQLEVATHPPKKEKQVNHPLWSQYASADDEGKAKLILSNEDFRKQYILTNKDGWFYWYMGDDGKFQSAQSKADWTNRYKDGKPFIDKSGKYYDPAFNKQADAYFALKDNWDAKRQFMLDNPEFADYFKKRFSIADGKEWWLEENPQRGWTRGRRGSGEERPSVHRPPWFSRLAGQAGAGGTVGSGGGGGFRAPEPPYVPTPRGDQARELRPVYRPRYGAGQNGPQGLGDELQPQGLSGNLWVDFADMFSGRRR